MSAQPVIKDTICEGNCDEDHIDLFGMNGDQHLVDQHIDADQTREETLKKIYDAVIIAGKLGGNIPGWLNEELGILSRPVMCWEDFVRNLILRKKKGSSRNDWTKIKSRPLFAGLYIPHKKTNHLNILVPYDCSESMSKDDIAFGISQLQVIGERSSMWLCPFDTEAYWKDAIRIKKANIENLKQTRVCGRGGTMINRVFQTYEDQIGKVDLIIVLTDGFLWDGELKDCKFDKNTDIVWVITSHNPSFKPPKGRVFHLRNEHI
jgi:predicted metal-dependent peptidase